jgi:hypothetical protein
MYFINIGYKTNRSIDENRRDNRLMRPLSFPKERLSSYIDLRRWMTPIEHQQDMNTWFHFKNKPFSLILIEICLVVQMHLLVFVNI